MHVCTCALTPCKIPPTADIKCWQARRDRGQKCRRARHDHGQKCRRARRDRGQFGGEPAVGAVKLVASPPRARSLMSISHLPTSPSNIKGWRARRGRGQKCRRARRDRRDQKCRAWSNRGQFGGEPAV